MVHKILHVMFPSQHPQNATLITKCHTYNGRFRPCSSPGTQQPGTAGVVITVDDPYFGWGPRIWRYEQFFHIFTSNNIQEETLVWLFIHKFEPSKSPLVQRERLARRPYMYPLYEKSFPALLWLTLPSVVSQGLPTWTRNTLLDLINSFLVVK